MRQVISYKGGVTIILTAKGYSIVSLEGKKEDFDRKGRKIGKKSNERLTDVANIGDYVSYIPSITRYRVSVKDSGAPDQFFDLSKLKSWRIFRNDGDRLEIITAGVIPELELKGRVGYARLVKVLNGLGGACVNSRFALSGRCLGSSERSVNIINAPTWSAINSCGKTNVSFGEEDFNEDVNQLKKHGLELPNDKFVWLASRMNMVSNNRAFFGAWCMQGEAVVGGTTGNYLYGTDEKKTEAVSCTNMVRLIVRLKPDVKVAKGTGTKGAPFVLV